MGCCSHVKQGLTVRRYLEVHMHRQACQAVARKLPGHDMPRPTKRCQHAAGHATQPAALAAATGPICTTRNTPLHGPGPLMLVAQDLPTPLQVAAGQGLSTSTCLLSTHCSIAAMRALLPTFEPVHAPLLLLGGSPGRCQLAGPLLFLLPRIPDVHLPLGCSCGEGRCLRLELLAQLRASFHAGGLALARRLVAAIAAVCTRHVVAVMVMVRAGRQADDCCLGHKAAGLVCFTCSTRPWKTQACHMWQDVSVRMGVRVSHANLATHAAPGSAA